ncbi:MAG: sugar ABC transporter permease [Defluviitaleaceae bacterium]|nr:sugar ABC transporter permease [Defluviitaleaceae bacterium]
MKSVAAPRRRTGFAAVWNEHKGKYILIIPFVLIFFVFTFIPVVMSIFISFTDFNMLETPRFVGAMNYINLFTNDAVFLVALQNTLFLALVTGPASYLLCFIFAWLINGLPNKIRAVLTLVFYAPSISGSAFLIWGLIFHSDSNGFANAWLMRIGLTQGPIWFFDTRQYIMPIIILVQLWLSLGVSFLAFIAGLKNVDTALYESGSIDGITNRWQELWFITLPSMKPQLLFGAVMQITIAFSISDISMELAGFPSFEYAAHTILVHLHDFGSIRMEMGYASAIATILFFMMVLTNLLVQKLLRRVGE